MEDELELKLNKALDELSDIKSKNEHFHFCLAICMVDGENEDVDNVEGEVAMTSMNYQVFETMMLQLAEGFDKNTPRNKSANNLTYDDIIRIWGKGYDNGNQFN
tara:strand:- start:2674 stop:2985 length:312 start_codon:yes stop_codon:yes gene_type:complete